MGIHGASGRAWLGSGCVELCNERSTKNKTEGERGVGQWFMASRFVLYQIKVKKASEELAVIYMRSVHFLQLVTGRKPLGPSNMPVLSPSPPIVIWEAGKLFGRECIVTRVCQRDEQSLFVSLPPISSPPFLRDISYLSHKESGYKSSSPLLPRARNTPYLLLGIGGVP
ncbi:hypothetical protein LZ30DRAFT_363259 [Colletotrichum cereale]|nr:hypothetical protein LZ30DRAFT_363259 [Colletotrichum cereale]